MALTRGRGRFTSALTWVPGSVLMNSPFAADAEDEAEALCAVARGLGVDIAWVPAEESWAALAVNLLIAEGIRPAWAVAGVLGRVAGLLGWVETIRESTGAPGQLAVTIDRARADALEAVRRGGEAGCDLLVVADDLAGASGWIISPDFALDSLMPSYRTIVQQWYSEAIFHSDGDVRVLLPALRRAGFDGVHAASLRQETFTAACERAWPLGLEIVGGLPAILPAGSSSAEAGHVAGELATRGPLVVADDGGIASSEQLAAVGEALRAAREAHAAG